ncbi:hypothetical protein BGZ76_005782, partial [Entomortierella beljakovae]
MSSPNLGSGTPNANNYASSIGTPPSSVHAPAPPHPPLSEDDDLDQKMVEFRRYYSAKSSSMGPDLIFNVPEYATFLPRPLGIKERSYEKSPSANNWVVPPSPPRTVSGYAAGFGPILGPTNRSNKITYHQCQPLSPPEMLRESTE